MSDVAVMMPPEASSQADDTEAYRRAPYPTALHPVTHPDRMAVIARLAGMTSPPVPVARVLEVGCGNGMNLLAMAAARPGARFVGIDIVADAIVQGQGWAEAAGLDNVDLRVADLLDPAALEGPFDYIIAHGVFAWVPADVADALLALIGRHLAPDGVAFVSFNALPGSYLRMGLREAMLFGAGEERDPARRMEKARAVLGEIGGTGETDNPLQAAFRFQARLTAARSDTVLLHDELGGNFRPRYLNDMAREAAVHGLAFLGDAKKYQIGDAFLPDEIDGEPDIQAQTLARAVMRDWVDMQSFRAALLVRADRQPTRRVDPAVVRALYVSSSARFESERRLIQGSETFDIPDDDLLAALSAIIAAYPVRIPIAALGLDEERLQAMVSLFDAGVVTLHADTEPFAVEDVGARPVASPLARMMIAAGMPWIATLDHHSLTLDEGARGLLLALDGSGDEIALAKAAEAAGFADEEAVSGAIAALARLGVFVR